MSAAAPTAFSSLFSPTPSSMRPVDMAITQGDNEPSARCMPRAGPQASLAGMPAEPISGWAISAAVSAGPPTRLSAETRGTPPSS